jgi:phosphoglucomutase
MIDRVVASHEVKLFETPVGFKWFVKPLMEGEIFFGGEESAGASFLRKNAQVWSTDKDGMILNLLAAEILATTGKDPALHYQELTQKFGTPLYARMDATANSEQKKLLKNLQASDITQTTLAGEPITSILTKADNGYAIGGLKITSANGWFAIRPSGTEDVYKIYAESFISPEHLVAIQADAQTIATKIFER